MSITIIKDFTSNRFYPSANPINCTVNSNNNGKCNMRYICDVYIAGVKIYTNKLFPDPNTGYAFFQISRILQDYIKTLIPTSPLAIFLDANMAAPGSNLKVYCKFGEEYDSSTYCDGIIRQYTNLKTSNTFYVFQGAIDYENFLTFDYTEYKVNEALSLGVKFLTNSPRSVDISYDDSYFLDFITLDDMDSNYDILVTVTDVYNVQSTYTYASTSLGNTRNRYRIAVGPYDLNRVADFPRISQFVKSYTIQMRHSGTSFSETFTFNVKKPQEFRTRFAFVGLLGGIEHFTFYHRNKKSYTIDKQNYSKTLQSNKSSNWTYAVGDRGDTTYKVSAKETHAVATFCSRDMSEWLYEMWLSPTQWTYQREQLRTFKVFREDNTPTSRMLFWVKDTSNLRTGDELFCFPDTSGSDYNNKFTITSISGHIIDCGLTFNVYNSITCGWIQKIDDWNTLPIIISDSVIEVKQKMGKPIEYSLNYAMAYQKNTLRG
jgi:hypothetical protein